MIPLQFIRKVEHQQIVGRRRSARAVSTRLREFEVIWRARQSQHHPIESVVIFKSVEHRKAETIAVGAETYRVIVSVA
jgi:hypothetical protein